MCSGAEHDGDIPGWRGPLEAGGGPDGGAGRGQGGLARHGGRQGGVAERRL